MFQSIQRYSSKDSGMLIQPALEIGESDDEYEKEANATADKVMRMTDDEEEKIPDPGADIKKMSDPSIKKMPVDKIRKMPSTAKGGITASPKVEQGISSAKGSGQSLNSDLQQEMGSKMGADFSGVKIHNDSNAAEMSSEIGAKAFTHGNDIYFNKAQYDPSSNKGKHLLAHELTHTVQQSDNIQKTDDPEKLGDLTEDQRKGIKAQTWGRIDDFSSFFNAATPIDKPELGTDVKILYGKIPEQLKPGFQRVCRALAGSKVILPNSQKDDYFPINTTVTLGLDFDFSTNLKGIELAEPDKTKYNGSKLAFRFTFFSGENGKEILIEDLGPMTLKAEKESQDDTLFNKYFILGTGNFKTAKEITLLIGAINGINESLLAAATTGGKITINRKPNHAGDEALYDINDHTITVYDVFYTLENSDVVFGDAKNGYTSGMSFTIIHELGHAIDWIPVKPLYDAYLSAYRIYEKEKTQDSQTKFLEAQTNYLNNAKSVSGTTFNKTTGKEEQTDPAPTSASPASPYGTTSWKESFAESFALYSSDPEKLKLIRPEHYTYFQSKYKLYPE